MLGGHPGNDRGELPGGDLVELHREERGKRLQLENPLVRVDGSRCDPIGAVGEPDLPEGTDGCLFLTRLGDSLVFLKQRPPHALGSSAR